MRLPIVSSPAGMARLSGDASPEKLREVVERGCRRSAVFDMVSNGVPVDVDVVTP